MVKSNARGKDRTSGAIILADCGSKCIGSKDLSAPCSVARSTQPKLNRSDSIRVAGTLRVFR